ncbi:MAG TPA: ECF-type sigma factor [Candidatus Eisenbacteria bacterium]
MGSEEITRLLVSAREGTRDALNALIPHVYEELHSLAHRSLFSQRPEETLNTTALVHEAFLKLHARETLTVADRRHFFAVAAMAMRQIVVDHARRRLAGKRGGDLRRVDLDSTDVPVHDGAADVLALEEALQRLSDLDSRLGRVVELRFFGGLTVDETAEVLEVDPRTVKRDWRKARAVLTVALRGAPEA